MRLTEILVDNLLTFESLSLPIRPGLNIVVGPNGVGKSHIVRLITLCSEALTASMGIRREELNIRPFLRLGSPSPSGSVTISFECTLDSERALMIACVRAITVSSIKRDAQVSRDVGSPFEVMATNWVKEHVTTESIAALLAPRLVLWLA